MVDNVHNVFVCCDKAGIRGTGTSVLEMYSLLLGHSSTLLLVSERFESVRDPSDERMGSASTRQEPTDYRTVCMNNAFIYVQFTENVPLEDITHNSRTSTCVCHHLTLAHPE